MKKIFAMGASNSKKSINKTFAEFAANNVKEAEVNLIDLNDYEMPIFSIEREAENGIHELAVEFKEEVKNADGIVISFAEHNGAYSAAFKNIYDWVSRMPGNVWENKPLFLLAASPGGLGGKNVLEIAYNRFHHGYRNTIAKFSLPSFKKNFSEEKGILDFSLKTEFAMQLAEFENAVNRVGHLIDG